MKIFNFSFKIHYLPFQETTSHNFLSACIYLVCVHVFMSGIGSCSKETFQELILSFYFVVDGQ